MMRYLSVCSGIEAASVAWEPLGWTPVAFAEIAKFPSRVLAARWPDVPNLGDFTAIDPAQLGAIDVLVGGTPCQAFSVAGRRASLGDDRGNLTLAFADLFHALASQAGTRWALWENVPGVLSLPDNAFGCFLGRLVGGDGPVVPPDAEGWGPFSHFYAERYDVHRTYRFKSCRWPRQGMVAGLRARAAWRVFDAQWFGLAQRRERVFVVVGVGDETDPAAVLFEPQGLRRHSPSRGETRSGATVGALAGTSPGGGWRVGADEAAAGQLVAYGGNNTLGPIDVATALNAHGGPHGRQDFESETFVVAPPLTSNPYGDHESREGLLVAHTLRGEGFDASEDGTGRGTPIVPVASPALPATGSGGVATGWAVRRLTPTECHRLQGFPDDHALIPGAADGPVYMALGNSMAVPVLRWIGERIGDVDGASSFAPAAE